LILKKILPIIPLLIWTVTTQAQQINTCGGYTIKNEFSAEWIIGGSLIDNSILGMEIETTGFENELPNIGLIDVNPTITRDILTITRKNELKGTLIYSVINSLGIALMNGYLNDKTPFGLDVSNIPAGHYIILFSSPDDKTFFVTKKFIKL
jgi:hypothetical protein